MRSPQTGAISIRRPTRVPSLRRSVRGLSGTLSIASARSPELTIAALGVLLAAAFAWVPSLWYDEGATVTSATRTWGQLWSELHHVDAVHGLYYACMHVWFRLVGSTPFTLRFPSALAVGLAAGLVVALGRRIAGRRVGVVAGVVFLLLPRVAWAGVEGRPYATITALSVGLTLVGLTAVRRTRHGTGRRWWVAYGVLAAVAVVFNVYLSLVVVAHAVALAWTRLADLRAGRAAPMTHRASAPVPIVPRHILGAWAIAAGCAAVTVVPFVAVATGQSEQVSWIAGIGPGTVRQVSTTAWFPGSVPFATAAWVAMAAGVVLGLRGARRRATARTAREALRAQAVRVTLPVVVVPTALLVGATTLGEHLYSPKYATLSLPFVAVLIALGLTSIRPRVPALVAVGLLVALAVPAAVAVKTPYAKQDSHWAQAAAIVSRQRSFAPDADEGVVYGSVWHHPTTTTQIIRDAYPRAFAGMTDLAAVTSGPATGRLWDTNGDVATTVPRRLGDIDTVWFLGAPSRDVRPALTATLERHGFHVAGTWRTGTVIVSEYKRTGH
ncbi:glycosyltransferase family 39 protein [Curtobacterium sp. MCBD17_040]|uniref:glycosyltransferase family 39 protein n=1 Tax=Curtobacterium sp. MCBD17_040 TaxID=2175674 RepID=UPI000DA7ACB7|nr:glycosyltransferase family 39 protein [Curtobacterium sp. MCBD17_040]WIB63045.1 glycosyltransferase family 39 protein [Curtobacterium sp. MCBD17_040]